MKVNIKRFIGTDHLTILEGGYVFSSKPDFFFAQNKNEIILFLDVTN